jgi:ornithine cyclodeaminase
MPVEDVGWGYQVYQNALEKGIGQELKLWDEPHWF